MRPRLTEHVEELLRRAGLSSPPQGAYLVAIAAILLALGLAGVRLWAGGGDVVVEDGADAIESEQFDPASGPALRADTGGPLESAASTEASSGGVAVHVVGAVRRPGLYVLVAGARVADAVAAAEGLRPDAAEQGVNLARTVQDGEQIVVPTVEEYQSGAVPSATGPAGEAARGSVGSAGGAVTGGPVDINSADAAALEALPGIGPATAQKIVADREANGRFARPEDLARVSGIGPKKLEALHGLIVAR